ncbi:Dihydrolipoyllysine-residue acetyltransferase component of pyruvate dehydrogenase complex [Luteitalea pratensis]|uniref:Acetyltransferase component of pyruvate dehydrogenase complex n=1 Tax=Luteitalea pratensis TaxID=1855912 RepID=A0A143PS73_LUTPR|nr:dihydrolipoyllysine-residue acetyltransferase [Luteitalea pratensis]AMY11442.1 Dihydrolipoyllysine-residue acetyltransferase component of pyruvate dehydrogenase complex [Luteitalea pratensis]
MANEMTLPSLGENIKAGDVLRVLIKAGDAVTVDQPVLELETDKATVEVPSTLAGTVAEVRVKDGDRIDVGQVVFTVSGDAATAPAKPASGAPAVGQAAAAVDAQDAAPAGGKAAPPSPRTAAAPSSGGGRIEVTIPSLGENVKGGDVLHVLVKVGDTVAVEQGILELETDKATVEVPSPSAGVVKEVAVKDGDQVAVGQLVLVLEGTGIGEPAPPSTAGPATPGAAAAAQAATPERQAEKGQPMAPAARAAAPVAPKGAGTGAVAPPRPNVPAAPSVRRLARELGLDIADVPGSGKSGRISETDVRAHAKNVITGKVAGPAGAAPTGGGFAYEPLPDFSVYGAVERKAMRGIRRKTAEHMVASWHTIPHVTQCEKVDITALEQLRKQFGKRVEAGGGKLTVTSIITKVIAVGMRKFPQFNTSVDLAAEEVIYKSYVNIGIAVDTERGLLVPVLRDVDTKSITQISAELAQLAEKARSGKLSMDEMSGGCFTITNLGGIGGTHFTPIVNHPEVAIMGMSRSAMEPVWNGTSFEPRLMMPLSLSYDHRIIDGADAMRFLRFVAEALEQPFLLAL